MPQQILHHERFVDGRSDLGHHDPVVRRLIRLFFVGMVRVHGVAQLVRQRERVIHIVLMVQQYKRVHAVYAPGERAGRFARALIYIDPVVFIRLVEQPAIPLAQRLERLLDQCLCLFIRHGHGALRHNGRVQVVHLQLVEPQLPLAQRQILLQCRQFFMHGLYELLIHGDRHVVAIERRLERPGIPAHPRAEHIRLHRCGIGRRNGVLHAAICLVEVAKRIAPDAAVRALEQQAIRAVRELDLLALRIHHGAEVQIHVGQHRKRVVRPAERVLRHGQDPLFRRREQMRPLAVQIFQIKPEVLKARLLRPRPQRFRRNF